MRYEENEDVFHSKIGVKGNTRSLINDDIVGSKPKAYGGVTHSPISGSFAGVSSGIKDRNLKEAPWGSGGNFDSTSYGKKWLDKTEK